MRKQYSLAWIGLVVGVTVVQFLAVRLGLVMGIAHGNVSPVWPATGFAIAVLLRFGVSLWPGVAVGSFLGLIQTGVGTLVVTGEATAALLEAVTAVWLVKRWIGVDDPFSKTRDVIRFCILAGGAATAISATVGVSSLCLGGVVPWESFPYLWATWWLGDVMGALVVAPFLITWTAPGALRLEPAISIKTVAVFSLLVLAGILAFWGPFVSSTGVSDYPLAFLTLPVVVLAAFLAGLRGATAACLICSAMAIAGTAQGLGPFFRGSVNESLLLLQSYLVVISVTATILAAVLKERNRALDGIRHSQENLENRIGERTQELLAANVKLEREAVERRQAEEALRESEERYRNFFVTSRDGVFMTTLDGQFTDVNSVALEMLGYTLDDRETALKKNVAEFYANTEERTGHVTLISELGFSKEYPIDLRKKDGTILHTLVTTVPRRDSNGTVIGFQGSIRDITERKRSEEVLRNTVQRFHTMLSSLYSGVLIVSEEGSVEFANQAFCDMFDLADLPASLNGLMAPEMIKKIQEVYAHPAEMLARIREIVEKLQPIKGEEIAIREDRTYTADFIPILVDGKRCGRLWHHTDITYRKRAEKALKASEEKYRLLVEKAREAIFVVQDTVFRYVNPRVEEILGFTADELLGNSFAAFVHPDDRETVVERHYRRSKGETLPSRYEIRIIDRRNTVKLAELDSVVIDWEGKPAVMVFLTDITYRKLAEEAAVQTERLEAIADLSSGVAHHFNNLLQIVMASTSLSLANLESGDLREIKTILERMLEAARLGAVTVRRLQAFASARADVTDGDAEIFDIAATARNAAAISKPLWKAKPEKKGIDVDVQLDLEDGCLVKGQENEVLEVLVNLIKNAAEALPQGGDIEVKAHVQGKDVVVEVRDTGIGISEEDLPRVFQPFWSSKGVAIGKGMGLAVTHGLVKRHGGNISVRSEVGKGATFTIRLPLAQEPIRKTEDPALRPVDGKLTILIIDDDENIAPLLEMMFVEVGHSAFKAFSGPEGLAIFDKEHVDLVLCDLGMPGMNGWDVGKAIRSICQEKGIPKPPFVLLTGWGGQDLEREKIEESGTDKVLAKPIDPAALIATVQEIASRFNIWHRVT